MKETPSLRLPDFLRRLSVSTAELSYPPKDKLVARRSQPCFGQSSFARAAYKVRHCTGFLWALMADHRVRSLTKHSFMCWVRSWTSHSGPRINHEFIPTKVKIILNYLKVKTIFLYLFILLSQSKKNLNKFSPL